jgi:hypothetical protein
LASGNAPGLISGRSDIQADHGSQTDSPNDGFLSHSAQGQKARAARDGLGQPHYENE